MSGNRDRIQEAHEAIERRAQQRHAAAMAQQELTPEAIAAEEERQRRHLAGDESIIRTDDAAHPEFFQPVTEFEDEDGNKYVNAPESLTEKLAASVQPVVDESAAEVPDLVDVGRAVFQWVIATSVDQENLDGYQLALQVQVDEQPPGGVVLEITQEMLERWSAGVGLQGNRTEHKRFAAGLVEKAIELASLETGNHLISTLEQLMFTRAIDNPEPTRTAVGDDWPMEEPPPFPADDEDDLVPDELAE